MLSLRADPWIPDFGMGFQARLIAGDEHGGHAPGLFGSFAVGAVRCDASATFAEHSLGRSVVVGGGLRPERVEVLVGGAVLEYQPATEPGGDPDAPLFGLQKAMMAQEAALASRIAAGKEELV